MKRNVLKQFLGAIGTALLLATNHGHAVVNLGTVGDSLTDEYLAGPSGDRAANDLAAWNWVQILAAKRSGSINFGQLKTSTTANWGGSRDTGYEFNWAKSGGVASDKTMMNVIGYGSLPITVFSSDYASTQMIGLRSQITSATVDTVFIGVGSNDFYFRTNWLDGGGNETPIALGSLDLPKMITEVTSGVLYAVDTALAAGNVNLLVGVIHVRDEAFTDARSVAITAAANQVNANLAAAVAARKAQGKSIAMVDLWGWSTDVLDPHHRNTDGSLSVGNLTITNTAASRELIDGDLAPLGSPGASTTLCRTDGTCATPKNATHFMADDGLHPNTVIQALLANEVIKALNTEFGETIPLLSDAEIESIVPAVDTDFDGIANIADTDDDNDGVVDTSDNCPLLLGGNTDQTNTDGDSEGNICDLDDDNDNAPDTQDAFPLNAAESLDSDGDGIGNNADADSDNDSVANGSDNCPVSAGLGSDQTDTDSDGAGNICDTDDDADGVTDNADAFPLNASETIDTDTDGVGNNADTDDDNDGVIDTSDNCPLSPGLSAAQLDTDSDGAGNPCDNDDDNDGTIDAGDSFPLNPAVYLDFDNDGSADKWNTNCDSTCQASSGITLDNCMDLPNADQLNTDGDSQGDPCDNDDDNDRVIDSNESTFGTDPLNAASGPELLTVISFESGIPTGWTKPSTANTSWTSTNSSASHLGKSLRSGVITHNQKAQIQFTALFYEGSVSLDLKTSTENSDAFRIYIDGVGKLAKAGINDWQTYSVPVTAGTHTIKLDYSKNGSVSSGSDAVWMDRFTYIDGTDSDSDGQIDVVDSDDDNDGLPDAMDPLPLQSRFNLNGSFKGSVIHDGIHHDGIQAP